MLLKLWEEWVTSLKFNTKSIGFNTWLYFFGFSFLILVLLGLLLSAFIKPYYRDNQIKTIDTIASTIETNLINKSPSDSDIDDTSKLVIGNNVCALIFNDNNKEVFSKNSLGELCMLDQTIMVDNEEINIHKEPERTIKLLNEDAINQTLYSSITGLEMLLYGKKISSNLSNYYLVLNTPLEPVASYIDFIMSQYMFVAIAVIGVAIIIAFFLARRITKPIVQMKKEANKLAEGDYNANFKADSYSEINDLANTLDDATNKLSKVDELRKDLVANVSHDIKTPLTVIQSYAEMIQDISGDDPKKRKEHLDVILKETDYLNRLVSDMQEYSKMQAGLIELNKTNFDLKDCVNSVVVLLQKLIDEKHIKLKKKLVSVIVYADEMKMSQVVYNFLSNAIKHSKDGGRIEIRMSDSEESIKVEVIDNGDGISEDALPYIWDRYYKIDKSFKRNENSTGLGLAIAKAILEAHKAKYGVKSKPNEGSNFYFELMKDYEEDE